MGWHPTPAPAAASGVTYSTSGPGNSVTADGTPWSCLSIAGPDGAYVFEFWLHLTAPAGVTIEDVTINWPAPDVALNAGDATGTTTGIGTEVVSARLTVAGIWTSVAWFVDISATSYSDPAALIAVDAATMIFTELTER